MKEKDIPGYTPFAFTNPIFVDHDGNVRYDAPGLPQQIPETIRAPAVSLP